MNQQIFHLREIEHFQNKGGINSDLSIIFSSAFDLAEERLVQKLYL